MTHSPSYLRGLRGRGWDVEALDAVLQGLAIAVVCSGRHVNLSMSLAKGRKRVQHRHSPGCPGRPVTEHARIIREDPVDDSFPEHNKHDKPKRIDTLQIPASKLVRIRVRVGKRHRLRQCDTVFYALVPSLIRAQALQPGQSTEVDVTVTVVDVGLPSSQKDTEDLACNRWDKTVITFARASSATLHILSKYATALGDSPCSLLA